MVSLRTPSRRRRLAGVERGPRVLQMALKRLRERVRASEHAPRGPCRLLERRHGLAEIIKRGVVGPVESQRVSPPHREREMMTLSEKASRHGNHFAEQCLGFFKAPQIMEGRSVDGDVKAVKRENVVPVPSAGVGSAPSSAAMAWLTPGFLSIRLSEPWIGRRR